MTEGLSYVAGAVVVLAVLVFVGWPLIRRQPDTPATRSRQSDPAEQRTQIYRELIELELDHRIGKLTAADYHEQSEAMLGRAAALIVAEDIQVHTVDDQLEREIRAMRAALRLAPTSSRLSGADGER